MHTSINHNNMLSELPFHNLDNYEFLRITGGWVHHSYHSLTESKDLFQDIIASPEEERELQETSYKCIKLASKHISECLTSIFNQSLQQGVVPDILKISKVTPIDKGGETTDPANYRPISTLSTFTQIFEQCIYNQLINYIEKHKIIFQFQFGFRKGHSTAQAITEITNTLRKAIDDNLYTCGVFLDFSKAFDTVNHTLMG